MKIKWFKTHKKKFCVTIICGSRFDRTSRMSCEKCNEKC